MKDRKGSFICLLVLGIALVCIGLFVLKGETVKTYSGGCIGVGSGLFGLSVANLILIRIRKKNPQITRIIDVEAKDERTMRINDMARAKAFAVMQILYAALVIVLSLMGERLLIILLVWGVFMFGWVIYFAYFAKYAREI